MIYEIYLITNKQNNKKYIGQTKIGIYNRWQEHLADSARSGPNRLLYNAIKKYGVDNFTIELLETNIPENLIDQREQEFIKQYNTYYLTGYGYNMTLGGQGIHGYAHTDLNKQKISLGAKTRWEEIRQKEPEKYQAICTHRSEIAKGKPKSKEHRHKLSVIASQRTGTKNPFYGKHFTEDSKEKLRAAWDKRVPSVQATHIETGEITTYRSVSEAVRALNLNSSAVSRIALVCKNEKGKAYNHYWCYTGKDGDE